MKHKFRVVCHLHKDVEDKFTDNKIYSIDTFLSSSSQTFLFLAKSSHAYLVETLLNPRHISVYTVFHVLYMFPIDLLIPIPILWQCFEIDMERRTNKLADDHCLNMHVNKKLHCL